MSDSDDRDLEEDEAQEQRPARAAESDLSSDRGAAGEVTVREGRRRKPAVPPASRSDRPGKAAQARKPRKRRAKRGREGNLRPDFLASFPDDPELSRVVEAFERGDYATVRRGAARLAKKAKRKRVREAARELLDRLDPDPLAKVLLAAAFALLLFLVIWTYAAH